VFLWTPGLLPRCDGAVRPVRLHSGGMGGDSVTQVWSCGGGTQSAAIAALIVQGRLPKPDIAAIVDTGRERSSTWEYMDGTIVPALSSVGVDMHRVPQEGYAHWGLAKGESRSILLPMFTDEGKLNAFCSNEWKRRVLQRWLREHSVDQCDVWIGISLDEMKRVRAPKEKWYQERYPLIFDLKPPMRRGDCVKLVEQMGWPTPPRSSCWCCPNMGDREWRDVKENYPEDFEKAVQLEREIRRTDAGLWLHKRRIPLDMVDIESQLDMFDAAVCATGMCWV